MGGGDEKLGGTPGVRANGDITNMNGGTTQVLMHQHKNGNWDGGKNIRFHGPRGIKRGRRKEGGKPNKWGHKGGRQ